MPINELEQHPYLNYHEQFQGQITNDYYKGIIIGSFPIYAVTDTIDINGEIIEQRFNIADASMRFFYGSRKSDFWKYVGLALNGADPRKDENGAFLQPEQAVENCKQLLFSHRLLISDSLYRTNRTEQGAEDSGLMVNAIEDYVNALKSVNLGLIELLRENKKIQNIYFTATALNGKSPYGWFLKIFGNQMSIAKHFLVGERAWSAIATISLGAGDVRQYNLFFLPTPKPRGIHWNLTRTVMFENYLIHHHPAFYQQIDPIPTENHNADQTAQLSVLRVRFLVECYRKAIVHQHVDFDGSQV